jgi:Rps23 Pro-64 3,4-dihydroxylase Tpa1-like proline 4-hydroxylase
MTVAAREADLRAEPFPHATHAAPLPAALSAATLDWMETAAPWQLRIASFYEQWELHLEPGVVPAELRPLLAIETIDHLRSVMLAPLAATRAMLIEVTAHKLVPGQTIRVHNDYLDDGETHRLLVQFNRSWQDAQGGLLMLFGSASPEDVRRILRPVHGSAMAFPISPQSFHAVSTVRHGHRYTLVYSFKAESAA